MNFWALGVAFFVTSTLFMTTSSFGGQLVLTFDDAPRGNTQLFSGKERTKKLIQSLKNAGVSQAAFYCTPRDLTGSRKTRLTKYAHAGHIIANHTLTHPDLHKTSVESYLKNIQQAHQKLKGFATFKKWFRFPFLREGESIEKRDQVRLWLKENGYQNGYVTVDNYDWYMDSLLQKGLAKGKSVDFKALGALYTKTLWQGLEFYDQLAKKHLKRSPVHVVLLHENDLAALYIEDLVKLFKAKGWEVVRAESSFKDPIATKIPKTLILNQGRVAALAADLGAPRKSLFSKFEDETYLEQIFEDAKIFK